MALRVFFVDIPPDFWYSVSQNIGPFLSWYRDAGKTGEKSGEQAFPVYFGVVLPGGQGHFCAREGP